MMSAAAKTTCRAAQPRIGFSRETSTQQQTHLRSHSAQRTLHCKTLHIVRAVVCKQPLHSRPRCGAPHKGSNLQGGMYSLSCAPLSITGSSWKVVQFAPHLSQNHSICVCHTLLGQGARGDLHPAATHKSCTAVTQIQNRPWAPRKLRVHTAHACLSLRLLTPHGSITQPHTPYLVDGPP